MKTFPDFGKELKRPFEVDERCFDCAELYHGCNARPESPDSRCLDYLPLPNVGVNGTTGQEIPPSRMGGRKEPRVWLPKGRTRQAQSQPEKLPASRPRRTRQLSPAGVPGPDGQRLCKCGALLEKRARCCADCRAERRKETMQRRRHSAPEVQMV